MGVPGLWDILNAAGRSRSLTHLAWVDGFEANKSQKRAFRIGIDASIWYNHAPYSKGGENPQLRLLFFRIAALAKLPLLLLFVFDGCERPKIKRGSRMGKSGSHTLTAGMKEILDAFGMEWRAAPGEAEAELAHLNRSGVIDAVMTDDVDALIFGARTVIKNPSLTLSGNKSHPTLNSEGNESKEHVMVFTTEAMRDHAEVGLSRGGLILFALLTGGDYDYGVEKFGKGIAHALARAGFGDELLEAFERRTQLDIQVFLRRWRASINNELHTNSRGYLRQRYSSLNLLENFPDVKLLDNYANPVTSALAGRKGGGQMRDTKQLNLARIAGLCEAKFEWGHHTAIIKRFRTLLWEAAIIHVLRRAALKADENEKTRRAEAGVEDMSIHGALKPPRADAVGTPASFVKKCLDADLADRVEDAFVNRGSQPRRATDMNPLILKIVGTRSHISTDRILQYRVEVSPSQLIAVTRSGIKGTRPEPPSGHDDLSPGGGSQKKPLDPQSTMRMWIAASIMHQVHPNLVEDFAVSEDQKAGHKAKGKAKEATEHHSSNGESGRFPVTGPPAIKNRSTARKTRPQPSHIEAERSSQHPDLWFTIGGASDSQSGRRGFLFSFPDSDDPSNFDSGGDDATVDTADDEDVSFRAADRHHPDRFDLLFDQIMRPRKEKKSTLRNKRSRASAPGAPGSIDVGGRVSKRRKTIDNLSSITTATRGARRYFPIPSSSQESSLLDDAEIIIDLT